jgi:probable F420-dependent oxidoreductase
VRIDTTLGPLDTAFDVARAAEEDGYDGIFTGELGSDPFLPLALAASSTESIALGTSIAVALSRSPMSLAYTAYDLQRLSKGRLVLGLGSQVKAHITRRYSMSWGRPASQMRDFILALRAVWGSWSSGEPLRFDSEHYRHTLMPPNFAPARHAYGDPEVLLAGVGDVMTRVAGEVADGFICHAFTTERWIREHTIPALAEGRRRVGRSLDGFTTKAAFFLATGSEEDRQRAVERIRPQIAFYASTPAYRPVVDLHGWGEVGSELTRLSKDGRWSEMAELVTDDMVETFAIVAPLDQVPARVAQRCAGLVNRVSFISDQPSAWLIAALRRAGL